MPLFYVALRRWGRGVANKLVTDHWWPSPFEFKMLKYEKKIHPGINEIPYFDSIPQDHFRVTKPVLSFGSSQRIFPLLDPRILNASVLHFHKYLGFPFSLTNSREVMYFLYNICAL